jgi:SAM-dependent methyltransferase
MVREARQKVPQVPCATADISGEIPSLRDLEPQSFDIILCAFDTINHVTSFSGWKKVFRNARYFLKPDGIFVFDINTERKLTRYYEEPPFADCREDSTSVFQVFKYPKGRFDIEVQVFKRTRAGVYSMKEMVVEEVTFPVPKIVSELSRHFTSVHILDLDRKSPNSKSEELYFICRK